jgi:HEAT repeat protein
VSSRGPESPAATELVRRGRQSVPAIVAELQRHPYQRRRPGDVVELAGVPSLLRVLGRIGGDEVKTELHRWTAPQAPPNVRAVAIDILATQGDRSVLPDIEEMLSGHAGEEWKYHRPELFHALGALKAGNEAGLIGRALRAEGERNSNTFAAVTALAAIDNDESWALIFELAENPDPSASQDVVRALEKCPGPRTMALLGKLLDDSDPTRRHAAYRALQRVDPQLLENGPDWIWSEQNERRLRAAVKQRLAGR